MGKFLVLKILDSQSVCLPSSSVYGVVELRSSEADFECEIDVLKESASNNRADYGKFACCARIATIVDCGSEDEAIDTADNLFSEVLDLKSVEFPLSNVKTSDIGFVKNLESGNILPITTKMEYERSMTFVMYQGGVQRKDVVNYILSLDNDLSERYKRSLHWVRNSKHESNSQLKILFYWFAIEALFKESKKDRIGDLVRWFLGFPNGNHRDLISDSLLERLGGHPSYGTWNSKVCKIVDEIRRFRNCSVHSGFRSFDFTKIEIQLYSEVMVLSASRCQAAVQQALINGISTASEFKEYISAIFEANENIINDVHGTILYSLERIKNA